MSTINQLARRTDPVTSHEAARLASEFAGTHCARIHAALVQCGPMDPEQIGVMVGMEPYACRKRLADLQRAKQAETTGELVPTTSGRYQRVWRAL